MKRFAALPGAIFLSLAALTASSVQANEAPSIKSMSMQCYTLYTMMMEDEPEDPYRNDVLGSQAVLMGSIHGLYAATPETPMTQERFSQSTQLAQNMLIAMAQTSRQPIVSKLIDCEGWREEILTYLALNYKNGAKPEDKEDVSEMLLGIPAPKASYPIKGVTMTELNLVVDEALKPYLNK